MTTSVNPGVAYPRDLSAHAAEHEAMGGVGGLTVVTEATTIATVSTAEEINAAIELALGYKSYGANTDGISPNVQIVVADGADITIDSLIGVDLSRVLITGSTPVELSCTSVQSSTGSSGSYTVTVNVPALVAGDGLAAGQKVAGVGVWSGGVNAYLFKAVSTITNVDLVNKRITFALKTKSTTAVPSGACAGTLRIWKAKVAVTMMIGSDVGAIANLAVAGIGMSMNSYVRIADSCGVTSGLALNTGSVAHCDSVVFGEVSGFAIAASYQSVVHADNSVMGNFSDPTNDVAVLAGGGSHVSAEVCEIYGAKNAIQCGLGGSCYASNAAIRDCITGVSVTNLSVVQIIGATLATNTADYSQTVNALAVGGLISTT